MSKVVRMDRPTMMLQAGTVAWGCMAGVMSARVYPGLILLAVVALLGLSLGLRWIMLMVVWLRRKKRPRLGWRGLVAWAFCPAVGVLLTALYFTQIPLAARVKLSEGALLELAEEAEPDGLWDGRRAGLMFVRSVVVGGNFVFYETNTAPIFRTYGLVYSRNGSEPRERYQRFQTDYRHLVGRWWLFAARD